MKLSEFKEALNAMDKLEFKLENGEIIPPHFHVTEVGKLSRYFIDCGGTVRENSVINFQLYVADDVDHRLEPKKLKGIVRKSERVLELDDLEIEVEYQDKTIGKYSLELDNGSFVLNSTKTDCLAKDSCGIKEPAPILESSSCCGGSSCC